MSRSGDARPHERADERSKITERTSSTRSLLPNNAATKSRLGEHFAQSTTPTTYQFDELPLPTSIRLLRLAAGVAEDDLRGEIVIVNLDDEPDYEAISYVWGTEEDKPTILIGADHGFRPLPITQNLAAGLRRF
jgi:hypothetical protein